MVEGEYQRSHQLMSEGETQRIIDMSPKTVPVLLVEIWKLIGFNEKENLSWRCGECIGRMK